ncbi:hypothetical protein SDC9_184474 [bioreactor metagenome]|uniref:Uncharacterized protein n=1 Tax=bioreactor metagenome TaxID=1076179 RepID=A0A645HF18_9ZZZZ
MHADAQIKGLQAAAAGVAAFQGFLQLLQQLQVLADGAADQHLLAVLQRLANAFAARYLAHTRVARAVVHQHDVAGEVGRVGATEIHEHAVAAGDGNDFDGGDGRGSGHGKTLQQTRRERDITARRTRAPRPLGGPWR